MRGGESEREGEKDYQLRGRPSKGGTLFGSFFVIFEVLKSRLKSSVKKVPKRVQNCRPKAHKILRKTRKHECQKCMLEKVQKHVEKVTLSNPLGRVLASTISQCSLCSLWS